MRMDFSKHSASIIELCKSYFDDLSFRYFCNTRFYKNNDDTLGQYYCLATDPNFPEYHFKINQEKPCCYSNFDHVENSFILPSSHLDSELGWSTQLVHDYYQRRFFVNPVIFVYKYDTHADIFSFDFDIDDPIQVYSRHRQELESFLHYFKDQASDIICDAENNLFDIINKSLVPHEVLDNQANIPPLLKNTYLGPKTYSLYSKGQYVILTQREYDCLSLLSRGLTTKSSAKYLKISHKTVEHHLCSIKQKTGLTTRSELSVFYWENQIS